ncbi:MAG: DUF692 domain-containing protein [Sphingomonadaceae bacterium]|nr:DUF692 domain-containing protein [Sphingomonadaceae bacterium]
MVGGAVPAGAGIGLRFQHHQEVLATRPAVPWLEVHTENYLGGGSSARTLELIRRDYPISLHGVGLGLGDAGGIDMAHLSRIRDVVRRIEPGLVSEHLSWSSVGDAYLADLLPLPMTEEALDVVCRHVAVTQDFLQRQILVENPSTYLRFEHSTIAEWDFLTTVATRTGCGILCDVNNIFVSASNHGWNASDYLANLPVAAVAEIHLAGHTVRELQQGAVLLIDDHGSRVAPDVWALYEEALNRFGNVPTLVEWDSNVPTLDVLIGEAEQASRYMERTRDAVPA